MKDPNIYLDDILESIEKIERYIKDYDFQAFSKDDALQDSVIRRLEIIGEAVKRLSSPLKEKNSHIPWKEIAGMRDVLIHEYAGILLERVWKVAKTDISKLKKEIKKIQKDLV